MNAKIATKRCSCLDENLQAVKRGSRSSRSCGKYHAYNIGELSECLTWQIKWVMRPRQQKELKWTGFSHRWLGDTATHVRLPRPWPPVMFGCIVSMATAQPGSHCLCIMCGGVLMLMKEQSGYQFTSVHLTLRCLQAAVVLGGGGTVKRLCLFNHSLARWN